jgi:hypothetical protein
MCVAPSLTSSSSSAGRARYDELIACGSAARSLRRQFRYPLPLRASVRQVAARVLHPYHCTPWARARFDSSRHVLDDPGGIPCFAHYADLPRRRQADSYVAFSYRRHFDWKVDIFCFYRLIVRRYPEPIVMSCAHTSADLPPDAPLGRERDLLCEQPTEGIARRVVGVRACGHRRSAVRTETNVGAWRQLSASLDVDLGTTRQ